MAKPPISFFVPGMAGPSGSKTIMRGAGGRAWLRPSSKRQRPWQKVVSSVAAYHLCGKIHQPVGVPRYLACAFEFERPKSHLLSDGTPRKGAPGIIAAGNADVTKLARATEDALKGILFSDDRQTRALFATSTYSRRTGCQITAILINDGIDFDWLGAQVHSLVQGAA